MTEEQLAAIEARANAATPGPWTIDRYAGRSPEEFTGINAGGDYQAICTTDSNINGPSLPDAEFICGAREDVPVLVAEVRRLRKTLSDVEWGGTVTYGHGGDDMSISSACPSCGGERIGGHEPKCALAAALGR